MPNMDGLEFVRQVRVQNLAPDVPVVMITTESSEEHVRKCHRRRHPGIYSQAFRADQVKDRILPLFGMQ